jgi:hypothetical protein
MAKQAYNDRPIRFSVPVPASVPAPAPALASTQLALAPAQAATVEDTQQWTQVSNSNRCTKSPPAGPPEKRRKGPGRPLGSTKAAKNTKDIQDVFNGLYKG